MKELLEIAKAELQDLTTVTNPDFRLEQAEFNKRENEWEIVVSYLFSPRILSFFASSFILFCKINNFPTRKIHLIKQK